jgi:GT2 family glycosyltransferase
LSLPTVTAVVLAYGPEPLLEACVAAILESAGVDVDVVLVDNGCTTSAVMELEAFPGVTLVRPTRNTGFTGGCNLGAARASGDILVFVNGDAVVRPDALARLAAALEDDSVGLASASLRLYDRPEVMNSAGNPVHFLGVSWAGGLGEPAGAHQPLKEVACATGAALAIRRELWQRLGGFWEEMFAYCEDAELSLRCWQQGLRVVFVPDAVVLHRYEFSRNPLKLYLLERNRLLVLFTLYERRTLAVLAPALVALELAVLLLALRQGWAAQKVRGWWWLLRHVAAVRQRRRQVQAARGVPDRDIARLLTAGFEPGADAGVSAPFALTQGSRAYWSLARKLIG